VHYTVSGEPQSVGICHCTDCQKQTASAFSVNALFPESAFTVTGALRTFITIGESGQKVYRSFCPQCGSPIIGRLDVMPGIVIVKCGTLDDTSWIKLGLNLYCASAQGWVEIPKTEHAFERGLGAAPA
jgi:hypothetical protein